MTNQTADELVNCLEKCKIWHEQVTSSLNDAERVEYDRRYSFFRATKYYYEKTLEDSLDNKAERDKELKYGFLILAFALVLVWFFKGSESISSQILFGFIMLAFLYHSITKKQDELRVTATIRGIERDFSSINISLQTAYKVIQKEKNYEKFWSSDSQNEEEKKRGGAESDVLDYYLRNQILSKITNYRTGESLPSCAYLVL
jgi:hypothetical protein